MLKEIIFPMHDMYLVYGKNLVLSTGAINSFSRSGSSCGSAVVTFLGMLAGIGKEVKFGQFHSCL